MICLGYFTHTGNAVAMHIMVGLSAEELRKVYHRCLIAVISYILGASTATTHSRSYP